MLRRLIKSAFGARRSTPLVRRALDLRDAGCLSEAEVALRQAVRDQPRDALAATNLAVALLEQDRVLEAVSLLERAITNDPACAAAHFNYGNVLRVSGRLTQAIEHYRAAKSADPAFAAAPEELMHTLLETCDWDSAEQEADELREKVARCPANHWMRFISPLTAVYLGLDRERCKEVAAHHAPSARAGAIAFRTTPNRDREQIRIGYFSRDFRDHPIGHLLRGVFALHDRRRFDVYAFSYGPDDGSIYRKSIAESVGSFVDVAALSDDVAARAIADARVDVLVELMGHTTGNRLGVLARRPAPIQIHYLGYAGTTGAPYIDYFISDAIATPTHLASSFTEEIAYVPDCFMLSDGSESSSAAPASRSAHHLSESDFVFANFGNPSRITREIFKLWMDILQRVPSSVLWLKRSHAQVSANLQRMARSCGVDPARLVFAERVADKSAHFSRLGLADLALDTIGWHNGHSTTADMLWAGVPVLTSPGQTFASRVASSLACAAGMRAAVTANAADYAATAIHLGNEPGAKHALRSALHGARTSAAFFDTARLVRGLESAYERMIAARIRDPAGL